MQLVNKFDYKPLERISTPNGRRYLVGEDHPLPSVTTILSTMKDTTHITEWKERVGNDNANKIVSESSRLGNGMHKILEDYILGKEIQGQFMAKTLANVIIKKGLINVSEVWGTEVSLYSKGLYAGTTDLIGLFNNVPAIIDFKNSIREKSKEWIEDYFLQLVAYALAHDEMYGTNINCGVIMMVTRDGIYKEFIIEGDEFLEYEHRWINKLNEYYAKFGYR